MKRVHYFSGVLLTVFIIAHLFNHFLSIWGAATHIEIMDKLRVVYRAPLVEILLLLAVVVQIYSGLHLLLRKRKKVKGFYRRLQLWTGGYLAVFLLIHTGAVLIGRYVMELDTNFYFGAAGLNLFPLNLFFVPYYSLAILSFFGHLASIHFHKMRRSVLGVSIKQQSFIILAIGVFTTVGILYGLTDRFMGVELPEIYRSIFQL